jgi:hypothetical protein
MAETVAAGGRKPAGRVFPKGNENETTFPSQCRPGPILAHRVGEWLSHSSLNLDSLPGSGAGVGWFAGLTGTPDLTSGCSRWRSFVATCR